MVVVCIVILFCRMKENIIYLFIVFLLFAHILCCCQNYYTSALIGTDSTEHHKLIFGNKSLNSFFVRYFIPSEKSNTRFCRSFFFFFFQLCPIFIHANSLQCDVWHQWQVLKFSSDSPGPTKPEQNKRRIVYKMSFARGFRRLSAEFCELQFDDSPFWSATSLNERKKSRVLNTNQFWFNCALNPWDPPPTAIGPPQRRHKGNHLVHWFSPLNP